MTARWRRLLLLAARLTALFATSYLLIATNYVPPPTCEGAGGCGGPHTQTQICKHGSEAITFHVSGNCGPAGDIVVSSATDECTVIVQGASAVNLPAAGRFDGREHTTASLSQDEWTLSDYPPEAALPDPAPTPDSGPFTVSSGPGGGAAGQHALPSLRTCTYQPADAQAGTIKCSVDGVTACEAIVAR